METLGSSSSPSAAPPPQGVSAAPSPPRQNVSISRIKFIQDVGRFRHCPSRPNAAFKKFTLIFGENGRGKTTLCAILRSLQTRQSAFILGRRTLGSRPDPHVIIELTSGTAIFEKGAWKAPSSGVNLRIFDTHYIAENIYSGDSIGPDQRRNLCRVILGQQGVALAVRYDEIDKEIGDLNATIRAARGIITSHAGSLGLDKFVSLTPDPDIDAHIDMKTIELQGLREIDQLKRRPGLIVLDMPPPPSHLESVLNRTLDDVSRDAEHRVRQHIASHNMAAHGEAWIATGLSHTDDETCPFCGQCLQGLDLLAAYKVFFNESYRGLQGEVNRYRSNAARLFSTEKIELLRTHATGNLTGAELWGRYVTIGEPDPLDLDQLAPAIETFGAEMLAALDRKLASPLDIVELSAKYGEARDRYATLIEVTGTYNRQVNTANSAIETFKTKTDPGRIQIAETELAILRARKTRFEPAVQTACDQFKSAGTTKAKKEEEKRKNRDNLDRHVESVLVRYQSSINSYLKHFAAGFHIDRVRVEYSGRVPNSTFGIVINDKIVDVGKEDGRPDQPNFRNTLSAGDRSVLALSFFFAQLKEDPDKSNCVVVFDDPFSSQDRFRRRCTIGAIQRCGKEVTQVVVLSHDPAFLNEIWDLALPAADKKALRLVPSGKSDTGIDEWEIERAMESEDTVDRRVLQEFHHQPAKSNLLEVIRKLRPVAETHMRRLAPTQLANVNGLGNMITRIRTDQMPVSLMNCLDDLTDINKYSRPSMHGENPNASAEQISASELRGFVRKLLEITGTALL